jgi:integrase
VGIKHFFLKIGGSDMAKRFKTKYRGVYYIEGKRAGKDQVERIYYISYYKDGKRVEEKAGRQFQNDMTPARANNLRAQKIEGTLPTNQEVRDAEAAKKKAELEKWTIDRLWKAYKKGRTAGKGLVTDTSRYNKYLKSAFGNKEPKEIVALEVDRMRISLLKKKSPQTVKHILNLLTWIINFGVNNGLCDNLAFKIKKPTVNNEVTEDLTEDQLGSLLKAIEDDTHPQAGNMLKLALFTGMRKTEIFRLQWSHLNFENGFIKIVDPKGGPDQVIPMNDLARELLENHPKTEGSRYVFPGKNGRERKNIYPYVNAIKIKAKLPEKFRVFHGLRHVFASQLASSGEVDIYTLQKLLTHKSGAMTQRYAHLRDDALRRASNVTTDIFNPEKLVDSKNIVDFNK